MRTIKTRGIVCAIITAIGICSQAVTTYASINPECRAMTMHPIPAGCFTGETLIATPDGQKPISQIRLGDKVLAMDSYGKIVTSVVTDLFSHLKRTTCTLSMTDGTKIRVTPEHVFFGVNDSVDSAALASKLFTERIGALPTAHSDFSLGLLGYLAGPEKSSLVKVTRFDNKSDIADAQRVKVDSYDNPEEETVYNFTVETFNNYFANGILVHNIK